MTMGSNERLLEQVRQYLKREVGLDVSGVRDEQLERRVTNFLRRHRLEPAQLSSSLTDPELREKFLDSLTINVTSLFRNAERWDRIAEILPSLGSTPKLWSAGCSKGAEAYTMGIICDQLGIRPSILATDIDDRILATAVEGLFSEQEIKEIPPATLKKYLTKQPDGDWRVDRRIASLVKFGKQDLLSGPMPPGKFDLIACRNVAIYFSVEAKRGLHARLADALVPGGYLFIGSTERVDGPQDLGLSVVSPFIYQRDAELARRSS